MRGIYAIILFLLTCLQLIISIKWLGIHRIPADSVRKPSECPKSREYRKLLGLTASHTKICRRAPELMSLIAEASRETISACQSAFAGHRWNCSSLGHAPNLPADLTKGTKEQAYAYALAAAALTHRVAKACATSELPNCPCGFGDTSAQTTLNSNSPNAVALAKEAIDAHKWRGCSDNVVHGKRMSREWTESVPAKKAAYYNFKVDPDSTLSFNGSDNGVIESHTRKRKTFSQPPSVKRRYLASTDVTGDEVQRYFTDEELNKNFHVDSIVGPKFKMNQHNSDVGRHIVEQSLYRKCKCHGVSNSCDIKTCWYALPPLETIAARLKDRYAKAQMIWQSEYDNPNDLKTIRLDVRALRTADATRQSLIYLRTSADYCEKNDALGSYGTGMRECNLTSTEPDSCESLCCGRGFNTQQVHVEEQCECVYVHCCYVKCKTCIYDLDKYYFAIPSCDGKEKTSERPAKRWFRSHYAAEKLAVGTELPNYCDCDAIL